MQYTNDYQGKNYMLTPEKIVYYIDSIFGFKKLQDPEYISIKVKVQESPGSIYFIADIESDLGNLTDRVVSFDESERGTRVFVNIEGSRISYPIGFIFGEYK